MVRRVIELAKLLPKKQKPLQRADFTLVMLTSRCEKTNERNDRRPGRDDVIAFCSLDQLRRKGILAVPRDLLQTGQRTYKRLFIIRFQSSGCVVGDQRESAREAGGECGGWPHVRHVI